MDYNSSDNSYENNSWHSGIKFVEKKRPKKFIHVLAVIFLMFFSASIGGVIGGYYVKKNYVPEGGSSTNNNTQPNVMSQSQTSSTPKSAVSKVAETVGPAVVGVENNVSGISGDVTQGSGSGIIFDKAGYVITNQHVIDQATNIKVVLSGGRKVNAKVVGSDKKSDLAVLKIEVANLPVAKFGDSSKVRVGDTAIAIGNPGGEEYAGTVTCGVISAVNRTLNVDDRTYKVLQTDASINNGNSGGALCNDSGEVIGINSLKLGNTEGIGFAISINEAEPIIQNLIKKGYVPRAFLGIKYRYLNATDAKDYNVPSGAAVDSVISGSAAETGGIQAGDVVVEINNKKIEKDGDIQTILDSLKIGDTVPIKLWRSGNYTTLKIKLGDSRISGGE